MHLALQYILSGLTLGSVYAVIALGFTLIYKVSSIVNFAQGDLVAMAALVMSTIELSFHLPVGIYVLIGAGVGMLLSELTFVALIRPAWTKSSATAMVMTMAISIAMEGIILEIWGSPPRTLEPLLRGTPVHIGGATIGREALVVLAVCVLLAVSYIVLLQKTLIGKALQACKDDRYGAELCGLNVERFVMLAFALSGLIIGIAAVLLPSISPVDFTSGGEFTLYALTAVVIGGLSSNAGAFVGGILVGILQSIVLGLAPQFTDALVFTALLLVMTVRPGGVLTDARSLRVRLPLGGQ